MSPEPPHHVSRPQIPSPSPHHVDEGGDEDEEDGEDGDGGAAGAGADDGPRETLQGGGEELGGVKKKLKKN